MHAHTQPCPLQQPCTASRIEAEAQLLMRAAATELPSVEAVPGRTRMHSPAIQVCDAALLKIDKAILTGGQHLRLETKNH